MPIKNVFFDVVEKTKNIEDFKKAVKEIPATNSQKADEGESIPTFDISDLKLYFDNDTPYYTCVFRYTTDITFCLVKQLKWYTWVGRV